MSKIVSVAVAEAITAAAAGIAAVGMGTAWLAKKAWNKGKALAARLSPEDRVYLLPFGADWERMQLEAATVVHQPLEGIDFGGSRPAFEVPARGSAAFPALIGGNEAAFPLLPQKEAFKQVETAAQALGFKTEQRALLPGGASILVLDLIQPERAFEAVPRQVRRRPV